MHVTTGMKRKRAAAGMRRAASAVAAFALAAFAAYAAAMDGGGASPATVSVNFLLETGPVKPMNAVNNGPKGGSFDANHSNFAEFRAANIPYGRTHDASEYICYGGDHCVDISAVFPDFGADENDPKNYDFPVTDAYLRDMRGAGTEPFFRLGQRIEHSAKRYNIFPPADFAKWARICEHVIRHYNEGWADGFRWNIKYWEIWNEADIDWKWKGPPRTWGGTPEQFFTFFEIAAKHLKGKFPHLKIGGPACGGNTKWSEMFFDHQRKSGTPMDFFSWHLYNTEPAALVAKARAVRKQMARYGYGDIESILNEWNYVKNWGSGYHHSVMALTSHKGAAFVAATMTACNAEPVDMLMYYDAKPSAHMNGMFDQVTLMPLKAYYAIYGWGQMAEMCDRAVKTTSDAADIYAVAAKGANGKRMVLVTRYSDDDNVANLRDVTIRLADGGTFPEKVVAHVTDYARSYSEMRMRPEKPDRLRLRMPPHSFTMIEYDAPPAKAPPAARVGIGQSVLFGLETVVSDPTEAIGELLPWKAPDAALELADEKVEALGGGAFAVTRKILNAGGKEVSFRDEFRVRDRFAAGHYMIPCVNYNGNDFGGETNFYNGVMMGAIKVPKGLSCDGKPWTFSYERTGVPSCTLTENDSVGLAVFAANDTAASLVSSCSLQAAGGKEAGRLEHVVIRPVVESPYTYESKGVFAPKREGSITLGPGETFMAKTFVCVCRPKWRNYAAVAMMEHALRLLDPQLAPSLSDDEVYSLGTRYMRSLFMLDRGKWLIAMNRKMRIHSDQHAARISRDEMAERMKWEYWTDIGTYNYGFEIGWAGQNFLCARLLARKALREGDNGLLEKCVGVYDAFISTQHPNGLIHTQWNHNFEKDHVEKRPTDVCNMGWGAAEAVRMARLLREHGVKKPEYVEFARKVCDFMIANWSDERGFGKTWRIDGSVASSGGSIGGFMIPALVELYGETKDRRYLDAALKAEEFYFKRDLDRFECTAGAIDCYCIDKETAYPFVWGGLALYRITGDRKHLERAQKAAWYFTSWMFFFDTVCAPETDFAQHGYRTTGGTSVSVEHQVIDTWGGIIKPELLELADLTGNANFRRIADLMWANAMQGITTRVGQLFHGVQRPVGSQNEGFFQVCFNKYRPVVEPGYFNDLLASWPSAYRVWTVERLRDMDANRNRRK